MSRVSFSILAILLVAIFAVGSQAKDMTILVGKDNTLTFTPQNGTVEKGDVVTFMFVGGTHSIVLADNATTKCNVSSKIENPRIAGQTAAGGKNATYTVTGDIAKIWYFCGVPGHCDKGMFGLLTLSTGANATTTPGSSPTDATMTTPGADSPAKTTTSPSSAPSAPNAGSGAGRVELSFAAAAGAVILYIFTQLL